MSVVRIMVAAVAAIVVVGLVVAGCSVHRRSTALACALDRDCDAGRICDRGYCVEDGLGNLGCPSPCTACDLGDLTCEIECTTGRACGDVVCPPGFDCTIKCNNAGACGDIDCQIAGACDITCSGSASCGEIRCGFGACAVDCSGPGACPDIACAQSCGCDVRCGNTAACPSMACPLVPGSALACTRSGTPGTPCDSSEDSLCDSCP